VAERGEAEEEDRKREREREREREMGKLHLAAGEMQRRRMRLVDGGKHRRS